MFNSSSNHIVPSLLRFQLCSRANVALATANNGGTLTVSLYGGKRLHALYASLFETRAPHFH